LRSLSTCFSLGGLRALVLAPALLLAPAFLRAAPVRPVPAPAPDIRRILDRGELVVAIPGFDYPPFFTLRHGVPEGVDIELAQGLARALGVKVRFDRKAATFNAVVDRVAEGEADVGMGMLSRTLSRELRVRFSDPYLTLHRAFALHRLAFARLALGRPWSEVIRHFTGTLGVVAGTAGAEAGPRLFPEAKVVSFEDWNQEIAALKRGDLVAIFDDDFTISHLLESDPLSPLTLRAVIFTDLEDSLGLAVAPDSDQLLAFINLYLAERPNKQTLEQILDLADEAGP
jgi:ABC-type amino acid transport substrate-binding protein